jgi:hypothetical protein
MAKSWIIRIVSNVADFSAELQAVASLRPRNRVDPVEGLLLEECRIRGEVPERHDAVVEANARNAFVVGEQTALAVGVTEPGFVDQRVREHVGVAEGEVPPLLVHRLIESIAPRDALLVVLNSVVPEEPAEETRRRV